MLTGFRILEALPSTSPTHTTYHAYEEVTGRSIAVKMITHPALNSPETRQRVEQQFLTVVGLQHIHIAPVLEYEFQDEWLYVVRPFLDSSLGAGSEAFYSLEAMSNMLDQIASALHYVHETSFVHGNLKPSNILVDTSGNAIITDFSISLLDNSGETNSLKYQAPEQFNGHMLVPQTDVFALGKILDSLLTVSDKEHDAKSSTFRGEVSDEQIKRDLEMIIQKATDPQPHRRFESVLELASAFRNAARVQYSRRNKYLLEQLTERHQEILYLISQRYSNQEIADTLVVSLNTVKSHISEIYRRLGVKNRSQARVRASELDLLLPMGLEMGIDTIRSTYVQSENATAERIRNPYKGLRPYTLADSDLYFGRERDVTHVLEKLAETHNENRFLALVAPSGSGKTSLVEAGIVPALIRGRIPGSDEWHIVMMQPGLNPINSLSTALSEVTELEKAFIHSRLENGEQGIVQIATMLDGRLLIIVDQFEEIFTSVSEDTTRAHFLDLIYHAVTSTEVNTQVMVALRADFYDRPLSYPDIGNLFRDRTETLLPLVVNDLQNIIVKPAEYAGITMEDGLLADIIADVTNQPGSLPLLQYALWALVEESRDKQLNRETYAQIGGVVGALTNRAEYVFGKLNNAQRQLSREIFLRLVQPGEGTEDTRRRVGISELSQLSTDTCQVSEILDLFVKYRLLSMSHNPATGFATVEVGHEALVQRWERLRRWLNECRHDIRQHRQLIELVNAWQAAGRHPDFLVQGVRLEHLVNWYATSDILLTVDERQFLEQSVQHRSDLEEEERQRANREVRLQVRARHILQTLIVVASVAAIVGILLAVTAFRERATARIQRDMAQRRAAEAHSLALATNAQQAFEDHNQELALALAYSANQTDDAPVEVRQILTDLAYRPGTFRAFNQHSTGVTSVALHPDGRQIISAALDGSIWINDIIDGGTFVITPTGVPIIEMAYDASGEMLVYSTLDRRVHGWDTTRRIEQWQFSQSSSIVSGLAAHPAEPYMVVGTEDGQVYLIDSTSGELVMPIGRVSSVVATVAIDPQGQFVAAGTIDGSLIVWNIKEQQEVLNKNFLRQTDQYPEHIRHVRLINANTLYAIVAMENGYILKLDVLNGEQWDILGSYDIHTIKAFDVATSHYAAGFNSGELFVGNLNTGEIIHQFRFATDIQTVDVGDSLIVVGFGDGMVRVVDISAPAPAQQFSLNEDINLVAAPSPDTQKVLTGAVGGQLTYWDLEAGRPLWRRQRVGIQLTSVAVDPTGTSGMVGAVDGTVLFVDLKTGDYIERQEHLSPVSSVKYSPDGQFALSAPGARNVASAEYAIRVWRINAEPEIIARLHGHQTAVVAADFRPGYDQIISISADGELIVWEQSTGSIRHRLRTSADYIFTALAVTADGQAAFVGTEQGDVIRWDLSTGQIAHLYRGHTTKVTSIIFLEDRTEMVTGALSGEIFVWDLSTALPIRIYREEHSLFWLTALSNGRFLTLSDTPFIHIWQHENTLSLPEWIAENRHIREFTCQEKQQYNIEPCHLDVSHVEENVNEPAFVALQNPELIFSEDFTSIDHWQEVADSGIILKIEDNILEWYVTREKYQLAYIPIPVTDETNIKFTFRITVNLWENNCSITIGLASTLSHAYAGSGTPTGIFVTAGFMGGGTNYRNRYLSVTTNHLDAPLASYSYPELSSSFIGYHYRLPYLVELTVRGRHWQLKVYEEEGITLVGELTGTMSSEQHGYNHFVLFNEDFLDWPSGHGTISDVRIYRETKPQ
ncbi:MAG: protein kinase [Chloroflexi bacterium]|nr:protein kinase [Chloroflexota bacterium]